jgi:hypothetical protein
MASDLKASGQQATIREVIGSSGSTYVIFRFPNDGSVCVAQKVPSADLSSAQLEFVTAKPCLNDCGVADFEGSTGQKGRELFRRLSVD